VETWNRGKLKLIFGASGKRTGQNAESARAAWNKAAAFREASCLAGGGRRIYGNVLQLISII